MDKESSEKYERNVFEVTLVVAYAFDSKKKNSKKKLYHIQHNV